MLDSWLSQLSVFVQFGRHRGPLVRTFVGVPEGGTPSGLLFLVYFEKVVREIQRVADQLGISGGRDWKTLLRVVVGIVFVDDLMLRSCDLGELKALASVLVLVRRWLLMELNFGPKKTALLVQLPFGKRVSAKLANHVAVFVGSEAVSITTVYEHVGHWVQASGGRQELAGLVAAQVRAKLAGIRAKVYKSGSRNLPLVVGTALLKQYWLPSMEFGMALQLGAPLPELESTVTYAMKVVAGSSFLPHVVLQNLFSLPFPAVRLALNKLSLLFRMVSDSLATRCALVANVHGWEQCADRHNEFWWDSVHQILVVMDAVMPLLLGQHEYSWVEEVTRVVKVSCQEPQDGSDAAFRSRVLQAAMTQYRGVLLKYNIMLQAEELQRCRKSLCEVWDLLAGPDQPPFVLEPRSTACQWRVLLRGGVRVAFGYHNFHLVCCPWCQVDGVWSIPHLLRDCPEWDRLRQVVWTQALEAGVQAGVMAVHNVSDHKQQWYLLTVGSAVDNGFCDVGLEAPTHFARTAQDRDMTAKRNRHAKVYLKLLQVTGRLLDVVLGATRALLKARDPKPASAQVFGPSDETEESEFDSDLCGSDSDGVADAACELYSGEEDEE